MTEQFGPVQKLLDQVRARWRRAVVFQGVTRASLAISAILAMTLLLAHWTSRAPLALAVIGASALLASMAAAVWALWPSKYVPTNRAVARFIEEHEPSLDERLVSAVDVHDAADRDGQPAPAFAAPLVRDAARAAAAVEPGAVIPDQFLRRRTIQALAACVLLAGLFVSGRQTARQAYDALALVLFPSRIALDVTPGSTKVQAGSSLVIRAQLVGNRAPVVAQLLRAPSGSDEWQPTEMESDGQGHFQLALSSLRNSFRYKVLAGGAASAAFDVSVLHPPHVARIDVEYTYPKALGLSPRVEEDGGDIYAPEGTDVRVKVRTDGPVTDARMVLGPGKTLALAAESPTVMTGNLQVTENGSYRVALADADGLKTTGDTEYFIRILDDRPPEVHITRPASDRRVTPLEEVEIAAEATDDFGVSALEFVYTVRGGPEKAVPLGIPPHSTAVTGKYVLYLEDLDVAPGDVVSYYARARDLPRGKRPSESRSDIFFLEVKPFEGEFTLAQTQAATGGGSQTPQLDDLVSAQKEVIVATWKLDRRSRDAQGAKSQQDIQTVSKAESDLKLRVEQTASSFRENTMRDPRRNLPQPTRPGQRPQPQPGTAPGAPRVGQTMPEEDAMTAASKAMGDAVTSLNALKTTEAMPPEMEALNALLKAQSDVKKRQIQRQQAGGNAGQNRSTEDLSSLFDKELSKHQQTNYENKTATEQTEDKNAPAVDRIKDLARRQDELVRKQQSFARNRDQLSPEEQRRQLEALTREQSELRERAEEVAKQLGQQEADQQNQQGQPGQQAGQRSQSGQPSGQPGQSAGQRGQSGQQGQRRPGESDNARAGSQGSDSDRAMRDVSEQMRNAASELRRADAGQASAAAARALQKLQDLEHQLQSATPEGRRRALGDLQLEARQLADAQRQIASESNQAQGGQPNADNLRRLAGEQERLAERLQRVEQGLKQQGAGNAAGSDQNDNRRAPSPGSTGAPGDLQRAASEAARDIEQQKLTERMEQSADALRKAAEASPPGKGQGQQGSQSQSQQGQDAATLPRPGASAKPGAQQDLARALDRVADRLNIVDTPQDDESRKLNDQVARVRELRDTLDDLTRKLQDLDQQASNQKNGQPQPNPASSGRAGQPGQSQGGSSGDASSADTLRQELTRQMQQAQRLLNEAQRDGGVVNRGGMGGTFEGQGMVLSAPGTEGFKQDFAKWQELKRQVTLALDDVETSLSKKLQDKTAKDRLASGGDDRPPAEYEQQVDSYFKALAERKRP
jgi:hypothetical protein